MDETDKIVEIARFQNAIKAYQLVELLESEGIDSFVSNEYSTQVMGGYVDMGGIRVETLESNVPKAMQIMQDNGYQLPPEDEMQELQQSRNRGFFSLSFDKQILVVLLLVILCFGLLYLYYNYYQ